MVVGPAGIDGEKPILCSQANSSDEGALLALKIETRPIDSCAGVRVGVELQPLTIKHDQKCMEQLLAFPSLNRSIDLSSLTQASTSSL